MIINEENIDLYREYLKSFNTTKSQKISTFFLTATVIISFGPFLVNVISPLLGVTVLILGGMVALPMSLQNYFSKNNVKKFINSHPEVERNLSSYELENMISEYEDSYTYNKKNEDISDITIVDIKNNKSYQNMSSREKIECLEKERQSLLDTSMYEYDKNVQKCLGHR